MQNQNESLKSYNLLDSGCGRKLERFGPIVISRPCSQAVWQPQLPESAWAKADAVFTREGDNKWIKKGSIPETWTIEVSGITFKLSTTDFGHLGIFPEQRPFWNWIQSHIQEKIAKGHPPLKVLNLFAYSGGSTLAAAKAGAEVCHLDASKGMVAWARENCTLTKLDKTPIRWIVDDVSKFLTRELRRGKRYDAIILDPPSFGRGSQGEVFKIEDDLWPILKNCRSLLSDTPSFVLFSCHTPGYTPIAMRHLMTQMMSDAKGVVDEGEMVLTGKDGVFSLPSGTFARWVNGS
jgi:23S rRNA (cytosine1962-C5)-methyltransferase